MLIWFASGAVAAVWYIFQSPAVDYRMVVVGAVLPVAEVVWRDGPLHTLAAPVVVLGVVMAATVGRRLVRRRWLGIPIGMFFHLALDGAWARSVVFWWPLRGWRFPARPSLIVSRGLWSILLELVGIGLAVFLWGRFGLSDPGRRRRFLRTGQLDRGFVGGRGPGVPGGPPR